MESTGYPAERWYFFIHLISDIQQISDNCLIHLIFGGYPTTHWNWIYLLYYRGVTVSDYSSRGTFCRGGSWSTGSTRRRTTGPPSRPSGPSSIRRRSVSSTCIPNHSGRWNLHTVSNQRLKFRWTLRNVAYYGISRWFDIRTSFGTLCLNSYLLVYSLCRIRKNIDLRLYLEE